MLLDLKEVAREAFGVTPDTSFLYMSGSHRQALNQLLHGIEGDRPFIVLTGEPGTGKTTLLFHLLEHYRKTAETVFIFQSQCSARELMHYVLADCDIACRPDDVPAMHEKFNELLISTYRSGKRFLLLLDEAQNFSQDTLEAVRLLSDFDTPKKKLLQIVFSGQPSFDKVLASPTMLQLRQRVSVYSSLEPLTQEETSEYIAHRLKVIGRSDELFSRKSLRMIFELTRGVPREIHNVCFSSLCSAKECQATQVDCEMVCESARRLRMAMPRDYVEEEKASVATAAAHVTGHPFRSVATAATHSLADPSPVIAPSALPSALNSQRSEAPPADPEMDRFRYLFEPGRERPVETAAAAGTQHPRTHTRAVLIYGFALIFGALVIAAAMGDRLGLKKEIVSAAKPPPIESEPGTVQTEVSVSQRMPSAVPPKSKPNRQQSSVPTTVPEITADSPVPHVKPTADNTAAVPVVPIDLSALASRDNGRQLFATVEPATSVRPNQPSQVVRSKLIVSPIPIYPEEARRAGVHGVVELAAVIDTQGKLKDIQVVKGHPLLIREAIKAAERQQYTPFLLNSVPQEVPTRVRFVFKP